MMIKMARTKFAAAAVAMAVGVVVAPVAAVPASAGTELCAQGDACNWRDKNYSVFMTPFTWSISKYGGYDMHDKISSVYSAARTQTVKFWKDENFKGDAFILKPGKGDGDLSNNTGEVTVGGFNDAIDSGKFI